MSPYEKQEWSSDHPLNEHYPNCWIVGQARQMSIQPYCKVHDMLVYDGDLHDMAQNPALDPEHEAVKDFTRAQVQCSKQGIGYYVIAQNRDSLLRLVDTEGWQIEQITEDGAYALAGPFTWEDQATDELMRVKRNMHKAGYVAVQNWLAVTTMRHELPEDYPLFETPLFTSNASEVQGTEFDVKVQLVEHHYGFHTFREVHDRGDQVEQQQRMLLRHNAESQDIDLADIKTEWVLRVIGKGARRPAWVNDQVRHNAWMRGIERLADPMNPQAFLHFDIGAKVE